MRRRARRNRTSVSKTRTERNGTKEERGGVSVPNVRNSGGGTQELGECGEEEERGKERE